MASELGITLITVTEHGDLVRTWVEPWGSSLTEEWLDKLADQQMWDYEQYGKTETFIRLPCGDLPLAALQVPDPESQGERIEANAGDPEMGTIDADDYERVASREEQHARYLDADPQTWDDDSRP